MSDPFLDERPRPKVAHEIGQALDLLSVEELAERIVLLKAEIERLERAKAAKESSRAAADAVFRR